MTNLDAMSAAIDVMARLRAPGGCPWDAEQTHASLAPYAIEEAHEVAEAIEAGTPQELQEELGDLLLQVLFHAEIAAESGTFTLADVANTLVEKLQRRHPHVFGDVIATTPAEVERNWAAIKQQEAPRSHPLEGIPAALPALMRAQKVISRAQKAGLTPGASAVGGSVAAGAASAATVGARAASAARSTALPAPEAATAGDIGQRLLAVVDAAQAAGIDAEQALRGATRELEKSYDLPPSL